MVKIGNVGLFMGKSKGEGVVRVLHFLFWNNELDKRAKKVET